MATGPDGRVVFVAGGFPGDRVAATVTEEHKRWRRADLVKVLAPSADRRASLCPERAAGCGGCGWMELDEPAQRAAKRQMVTDALIRLGRLKDPPPVLDGPGLAAAGFRTTVRAVVDPGTGRAGYRQPRSHRQVTVAGCLIAHPLVEQIVVQGRFPGCSEVVVRVGEGTGEALALVTGPVAGVTVPDGVRVAAAGAGDAGDAAIHELVAGRRWRISSGSFFQTRRDGAELLVARVAALLAGLPPGRFVDAYGGVGLLAAAAPTGSQIVSVEANPAASADAAHNLADLGAEVVCAPVERFQPSPADVVVADPARTGLEAGGVRTIAASAAAVVVLVSCDAGALGRDAGLLAAAGYRLDHCELIDLFPHTPRVEVISRFTLLA